ncbi:hypothetical protein DAPPUDRAFT_334727, partial [Daphnia pulex]
MATRFPLEMIEEEPEEEELEEDEPEEWQTTADPAVIKHRRISVKSAHTKSLNQALLATRAGEDVEKVKLLRAIIVREYEALKEIHTRYMELAKLNQEDGDKEYKWAYEVTEKQRKALKDVQKYLNPHLPKPEGSVRSSASSRSSTREKLQEAERLQKETELKIQQQRAEATERAAEEERMHQLETARKAEEKRIEAARQDRQLQMELEKQRLASDLLRQQLADENDVDGDETGKTADKQSFSIW